MASLESRFAKYYGKDTLVAQQLMNKYNNESAQKQMNFQEYMSDTAHQREVADLLASGLNPVLSANAGAPAMPGAYSQVDDASVTAGATKKLQTALQKNQFKQEKALQKTQLKQEMTQFNKSLKMQKKLHDDELASAYIINKYNTDTAASTSRYASDVNSATAIRTAGINAGASMYGAELSAAAARYASENQLLNNREQRNWDTLHPNNKYQLAGSIYSGISSLFSPGNSAVSNHGNNSTAK